MAVFELNEWTEKTLPPHLRLDDADRKTVDELAGSNESNRRLIVDELVSGIRVRPSSWVGVVRFSKFELRVVPKLAGGDLGVLQMLAYAGGISGAHFTRSWRTIAGEEKATLIDLVCWILADQCNVLINQGLLQSYVPRTDALPTLRGRLDFVRQLVRRYGQVAPLECQFEEFDTDILENRLLAAALGAARRVCRDPLVQARVSIVHAILAEAANAAEFDLASADRQLDYGRRNQHYREAHYWARVLLRGLGVRDIYKRGAGSSFAFLFDMNVLFEDFVSRVVEAAFSETNVSVHRQYRDSAAVINEATNRSYAAIRPDLLLEEQGGSHRRVPVDAKYKLYDDKKIDLSDVYQIFFYGYSYGKAGEPAYAALIYPSEKRSQGTLLKVTGPDGATAAHVRALPLNLPALLEGMRQSAVVPGGAQLREALLA